MAKIDSKIPDIDSLFADLEREYSEDLVVRVRQKAGNAAQLFQIESALREVLMEEEEADLERLHTLSDVPCASRASGLNLESIDASSRKSRIARILAHDAEFRKSGDER
ncbi:MAG TPA: hypothetical protein VGO11_19915 [Chthoniobacteraceae bacterium]|jgi:hypothetical protein|nr:hypothetical protein [Chthoniobacteraceae bacterium]